MNFKLLSLILIFGEFLAVTPPKKRLRTLKTKAYAVLIITILMTSSTISVIYYRQPLYVNFSKIKLVLTISMVVIVNLFNCYTVLAPVFCKRHQYRFLLRFLEESDSVSERIPYLKFVVPNLVYWVVNVYVAYVWTDILGFEYYQQYFVEVVQLYFQFYYNFFLCVFVRIFRRKYRHVNFLISEQIVYMQMKRPISLEQMERFPIAMRRIEHYLFSLKEINVNFNEIFGWPVIMTILYSSMLMLNYLDDIFKNSFGYSEKQYFGVIISNISVVLLTNVRLLVSVPVRHFNHCFQIGTLCFILLCDNVLQEAKKTVLLCYKLRQFVLAEEKEEISQLVKMVVDNFPEFTAAGFFFVSKTTVFHIIGTVTTFFIIIVQFNTSST